MNVAGRPAFSCGAFKVRERLEKELKDVGWIGSEGGITGCKRIRAEGPIMVVTRKEFLRHVTRRHAPDRGRKDT